MKSVWKPEITASICKALCSAAPVCCMLVGHLLRHSKQSQSEIGRPTNRQSWLRDSKGVCMYVYVCQCNCSAGGNDPAAAWNGRSGQKIIAGEVAPNGAIATLWRLPRLTCQPALLSNSAVESRVYSRSSSVQSRSPSLICSTNEKPTVRVGVVQKDLIELVTERWVPRPPSKHHPTISLHDKGGNALGGPSYPARFSVQL